VVVEKSPHKSYFRSHGYTSDEIIMTESGESCDLSGFPPFLRTLLVMDGTVTKALEAWFWEPVKVCPIKNSLVKLTEKVKGLDARKGDKALQREVTLQGGSSGKVYVCARSTVLLNYLPDEIGEALCTGKTGIGELFRNKGLETYRDIIGINYFPVRPEGDALLEYLSDELVSRSYQIWVNGHPAIVVVEFFPVDCF